MSIKLPPRGVFVPSSVLYCRTIPPVVRDTYSQLLGIAFGKDETPPIRISEFAKISGKSTATIYGHLASLRDMGALRWRTAPDGAISVTFLDANGIASSTEDSKNLETPVNVNDSSFYINSSNYEVSNQTSLTGTNSRNLENSENLETIATRAMTLFRRVTTFPTLPATRFAQDLHIIQSMIISMGETETENKMRAAFSAWRQCSRQDGRSYSLTNTAWLDYALVGEVPTGSVKKPMNGSRPTPSGV